MHDSEHTDEYAGPSRSQVRRDALDILKLAETLASLSDAQLAKVPVPEHLLEEVRRTRAMTQHGARKRQTQFLAKHMRRLEDEEITAIRLELDHDRQKSHRENAALQRMEILRERLIAEGDPALEEVMQEHPEADRQHLRQLIRQARVELERQKPPRASRELFRALRELHAIG